MWPNRPNLNIWPTVNKAPQFRDVLYYAACVKSRRRSCAELNARDSVIRPNGSANLTDSRWIVVSASPPVPSVRTRGN